MKFRILFQDAHLVAIDKPAGFHVHPPQDATHRISPGLNGLRIVRDQLGQYVYPVHRIDPATSGVVIYALSSEMASLLSRQFRDQELVKTYIAVTRGWIHEETRIDTPLVKPGTLNPADPKESLTTLVPLARVELPFANSQHPTSRYSLVWVNIESGRWHQIRRHLARISHPIIGDTVHGHGEHNRIFREHLALRMLCLKAAQLSFLHPVTGDPVTLRSRWGGSWHQLFERFGVCPYLPI
jgi:tRNA pseudouridine65 synthase